MRRLVIRNVGPIKDVDINLNKINVFIGPQSSGKSTIAKVISTCSWVEKEVATTMDTSIVSDAQAFLSLLADFHKMTDYFNSSSEILFETDVVVISLKGEAFSISLKERGLYQREKICYIPSERNAVTLPELQGFEFGQTNLRSFLFDWYNARESFKEDNKTDILDLGVRYFFDPNEKRYKDRIEHINGETYKIPLGSASSGLQSVVPLQIMVQYYAGQYFQEFGEKTSFESETKIRKIQSRLTDEIVLRRLFADEFESANRNEFITKANEKLRYHDPEALKLFAEYRDSLSRLTIPSRTSFIIEEPEQNLFPKTQMELLYYLLDHLNHGRDHRLVLTTHSPYVLYALNNCMLAYLVKDKVSEDITEIIECLPYALDPSEVSVWSLKEGSLKNEVGELHETIQDERGLIRKNYFNDVMYQIMKDFNQLLEYDD